MKTKKAIELAGNASTLSSLLEITRGAISQWGEDVPEGRIWQLRSIRPEWFVEVVSQVPVEQVPETREQAFLRLAGGLELVDRRTAQHAHAGPDRRAAVKPFADISIIGQEV